MNEKYRNLYEGLLRDTHAAWGMPLPESERTEACFKVCLEYWIRLKELVAEGPFGEEREEVDFFRQVKPLFTGRLEYYTLVYQYLLFCAGDDEEALAEYRSKELRKIAQFRKVHAGFIRYMEEGARDRDGAYFLRGEGAETGSTRIFDSDGKYSCPKDGLTTQMLAYQLYEIYIKEKQNNPV
jgi:hypothetical protein